MVIYNYVFIGALLIAGVVFALSASHRGLLGRPSEAIGRKVRHL